MPSYDAENFSPPAPIAKVILRNPVTGVEMSEVPMLLDTGADVTLLPQAAVALLGIADSADHKYELVGFDGSASSANVVEAALIFQGKVFRGQFLLLEQEWGILGRNILNTFPLLLDGPQLSWDVRR